MNIKLKNYNKVITRRNELANIYFKGLRKIKNIELFKLNKKLTLYIEIVLTIESLCLVSFSWSCACSEYLKTRLHLKHFHDFSDTDF